MDELLKLSPTLYTVGLWSSESGEKTLIELKFDFSMLIKSLTKISLMWQKKVLSSLIQFY